MSFPDKPPASRAPRAPRKPRARISLKMQAIGFLSRREHSRQELRAKLLDSLRKRARETAALAAALDKAAYELAEALREQVSNGIDDAFAPAMPTPPSTRAPASTTHRLPSPEARGEFIDVDRDQADPSFDDLPGRPAAALGATDLELTDPEAAVDQLLDWLVANKYLSETRFVESRVNARSRKQGTLLIKLELARHGLALEPEQAATLRETEFARAQALWQRKFGEIAPDARLRARQARFLAARGFAADVVRRVVGGEEEF
jgi:regulatory protein